MGLPLIGSPSPAPRFDLKMNNTMTDKIKIRPSGGTELRPCSRTVIGGAILGQSSGGIVLSRAA